MVFWCSIYVLCGWLFAEVIVWGNRKLIQQDPLGAMRRIDTGTINADGRIAGKWTLAIILIFWPVFFVKFVCSAVVVFVAKIRGGNG